MSSESDYYYSEYAPHEAREQIAENFNDGSERQWAENALADLREARVEEGKADFPFDDQQILNALHIDFEGNPGGSVKDPEFDWREMELKDPVGYDPAQQTLPGIEPLHPSDYLTQDMRDEIEKALTKAFDKEGDDKAGSMDVPDWVGENADEQLPESWAEMSDGDKFEWTKSHTSIVDDESTGVPDNSSVASVESDQVTGLPNHYDPLNKTSGTDYSDTQKLARYLSVERGMEVLRARGLAKEYAQDEVGNRQLRNAIAHVDRALWGGWKGSSTSLEGKLLQSATADELGGRLNPHSVDRDKARAWANETYKSIGGYEGVKAYVRAKWEVTQYLLDKAHIKTLGLYRGLSIDKEKYDKLFTGSRRVIPYEQRHYAAAQEVPGHPGFKHMPTLDVVRNGAASTTTDIGVANNWRAGHSTGIVLRAQVPRTAIVSVPAYGINVHGEKEVVVAGTAWRGWDVWAGKAPTFDQVPLRQAA
jgi:hypothetical protein